VPLFSQDTKLALLKRSPLFEGLSRKQLAVITRLTDDLDVPEGTVLCREGSRGREFFVIIEGEADVRQNGRRLRKLGPGDFVGEIALLQRVKRTATVTALTPLRFFVVSDTAFRSVLDADPGIELKILRALALRVPSIAADPTVG
jgi:CRP/FNR family transcriptional regulator, cyclic AMP receptor protein